MSVLSPAALSDARILAAYVIFLASYVVFALGKLPGWKIDRTGAAIIGAVGMVAFRIVRPGEALRYIDFPTIVLLFSMMLIVGNLHLVGFFEWSAEAVRACSEFAAAVSLRMRACAPAWTNSALKQLPPEGLSARGFLPGGLRYLLAGIASFPCFKRAENSSSDGGDFLAVRFSQCRTFRQSR